MLYVCIKDIELGVGRSIINVQKSDGIEKKQNVIIAQAYQKV